MLFYVLGKQRHNLFLNTHTHTHTHTVITTHDGSCLNRCIIRGCGSKGEAHSELILLWRSNTVSQCTGGNGGFKLDFE